MRNDTKTTIHIGMKHYDHSKRLYDFLVKVKRVANMGGDLKLTYKGAEKETFMIGHDVNIRELVLEVDKINEEK